MNKVSKSRLLKLERECSGALQDKSQQSITISVIREPTNE
jgi:hypothetical protein